MTWKFTLGDLDHVVSLITTEFIHFKTEQHPSMCHCCGRQYCRTPQHPLLDHSRWHDEALWMAYIHRGTCRDGPTPFLFTRSSCFLQQLLRLQPWVSCRWIVDAGVHSKVLPGHQSWKRLKDQEADNNEPSCEHPFEETYWLWVGIIVFFLQR